MRSSVNRSEFTAVQSRAARSLLGWSQQDLARRANVAAQTVANFEQGTRVPYERTLRDLRETLEAHGVMFIPPDHEHGPGVRLRDPD